MGLGYPALGIGWVRVAWAIGIAWVGPLKLGARVGVGVARAKG
jgi:hypothetical protein